MDERRFLTVKGKNVGSVADRFCFSCIFFVNLVKHGFAGCDLMNLVHVNDKELIRKLTEIVEAHLGDEKFGVKELNRESGLAGKVLRHRLKTLTGQTANQFITRIRLQQAMEWLQQGDLTAAEVGYRVGFGSSAYFSRCFHEHFGFPPGEVKRKESLATAKNGTLPGSAEKEQQPETSRQKVLKNPLRKPLIFATTAVVLLAFSGIAIYYAVFHDPGVPAGIRMKNREKSIAVLPFKNLSEEVENQYFADGVMEDILTNLSFIREMKVISRTSVEQFRESTLPIRDISKMLGVNYILEGSVQRSGEQVRLRIQFIEARSDRHLLSQTFDRDLADIFLIQSEIAQEVASALGAVISAGESQRMSKMPTRSMEAYNLYLMGRFLWKKRTKADQLKSIDYFEKALAADPDYALAYAGLADAYYIMTWWQWYPRPEGYEKAKELVLKALELDPDLAEAHATLGGLLCWFEWNWAEAKKELLLAIDLNPNYATGYQYYSEFLDITGDRRGARINIEKACELDPFAYIVNAENGMYYFHEGKWEEALEAYNTILEIDPSRLATYWSIFSVYFLQGNEIKALEAFQKGLAADSTFFNSGLNESENVFKQAGINGLLDWSVQHELGKFHPDPWVIASRYALLGKNEDAIIWLEKAMEERVPSLPRIHSSPVFNSLRSEPRFRALINQMGLNPYSK